MPDLQSTGPLKTITAIERQRKGRNRFNVFFDGEFALSLDVAAIQQAHLRVGSRLSQAEVEALAAADLRQRCHDAALRLLSYRPRSRKEISDRLLRRGFDQKAVAETLRRLESAGLLDDAAFAQAWKEQRQAFNPRSGRLIASELRRKGVAPEMAGETAAEVDDASAAYQAALKKARSLKTTDVQTFRRRLGDFLRRRGFSYEVASQTISRLWRELRPSADSPETDE